MKSPLPALPQNTSPAIRERAGTYRACIVAFAIGLLLATTTSGVTVTITGIPPIPGPDDASNLTGAAADMNNVYLSGNAPAGNGATNDGYTYVANDRTSQGQTFTTGSAVGGYTLSDIWVQHCGYTANTEDGGTSNGTFWLMAAGGGLTLRITVPSKVGSSAFVLRAETYATTGTEGWPTSAMGTVNGDGMWLHFRFATPVMLAANTSYGFDLTSVTTNNAFFEWLGSATASYSGGSAYKGNTAGTPDNTLTPLVGDRVFVAQMIPAQPPGLTIWKPPGTGVGLFWPVQSAGWQLESTTNLTLPWIASNLAVSSSGGFNMTSGAITTPAMFYRLRYNTGTQPMPVQSYQPTSDGLTTQFASGGLRLQVFSPRVVRVTYSLSGSFPATSPALTASPATSGWTVSSSSDEVLLTTPAMQVHVNRATGAVSFRDPNGSLIFTEAPGGGRSLTSNTVGTLSTLRSRQQFQITPTEAIYGLGQHARGLMNYRGASIHLQQQNPTESAVPMLVSSNGYGVLWDNPAVSDVSVAQASTTDLTWSSEAADTIDYYFMYGPAIDDVIAGYRSITGNSPLFARWVWGLWQCKNRYESSAELESVAGTYRSDSIPLDSIIQDWQYWSPNPWGSHIFNSTNYPDVPELLNTLHAENVHMMVSVWARFDVGITNANQLSAVNGLYPAISNVFPSGTGQWYDAFNPSARQVYWSQISQLLFSSGIDGWWLDASEPELSGNWGEFRTYTTAAGPGAKVFNAYPLMHTTSLYAGQRAQTSAKRVYILTRSAYAGQQRNAAVTWSGDIGDSFSVLAAQIAAGLNFSISGVPYWNTDTGGFNDGSPTDPTYDEIFTRWFQFSTFCPILRIHGNNAKEIWRFPTATESILINYDTLRYHLIPYIYSVSWMVTSQGYTMMRPLVMDFAADPKALSIPDQYLFGPALMACPVTVSGATTRQVYLPAGTTWYDFWTGTTYAGGQTITASAPIGTMPIYARAGSILPYGPAIQYSTQSIDPMEIRVYRGANGSFTFYEDENDNYDYESGTYATIPITWNDASKTLTFGARQGSFPGMLASRTFHVVWVANGQGVDVPNTPAPDATVTYTGSQVSVTSP